MYEDNIKKIKKIINKTIAILENNIDLIENNNENINKQQKKLLMFLIGNRENVVSIILKLSKLLSKISEMDLENKTESIEPIDWEIIKEYLAKKSD